MYLTFRMDTRQADYNATGGESITLASIHNRPLRDVTFTSSLGEAYQNFLTTLGEISSGLGTQERLDQCVNDAIPFTFPGTIAEWSFTATPENNQPFTPQIIVLLKLNG